MATLADIKRKVRILTNSQSDAQLTDANLLDHINTFTLYDMPYKDVILNLKKTLRFYTSPYIPYYKTSTLATDPLYNLKNRYITMTGPVRISGADAQFITSHDLFNRYWQDIKYRESIGTGDGATVAFNATLSYKPLLHNSLTISTYYLGPYGNIVPIKLIDVPRTTNDNPLTVGVLIAPNDSTIEYGTVDYVTGVVTINFAIAPTNTSIYAEYTPCSTGVPYVLFLFNDVMHLRPIPDKTYSVSIDALFSPAAFADDADLPELNQWWQYIAYGAAKKILEERKDFEGVQIITPALEEQESLVRRKKALEISENKTVTVYETRKIYNRIWPYTDITY